MIKKLLKWLDKTGTSKWELSGRLGINRSTLSRALHNKQPLPYRSLAILPKITDGAITEADVMRYLKRGRPQNGG